MFYVNKKVLKNYISISQGFTAKQNTRPGVASMVRKEMHELKT